MSAIEEAPPPVGAGFLRGMSPDARNLLAGAESAGHEAQALVRRALDWCERAGLDGRDFTCANATIYGCVSDRLDRDGNGVEHDAFADAGSSGTAGPGRRQSKWPVRSHCLSQ